MNYEPICVGSWSSTMTPTYAIELFEFIHINLIVGRPFQLVHVTPISRYAYIRILTTVPSGN